MDFDMFNCHMYVMYVMMSHFEVTRYSTCDLGQRGHFRAVDVVRVEVDHDHPAVGFLKQRVRIAEYSGKWHVQHFNPQPYNRTV